jgi:hypothetical protein
MTNNIFKTQFSAGELAPSLYARVDSSVYQTGAKKIKNAFIKPHGGIANRSGTEFVGQCRSSTLDIPDSRKVRLIPFQFSEEDTYILEFGHLYMRVIRDGGYVFKDVHEGDTANITGITKANPCVITMSGTNVFRTGDWVRVTAVSGMTEIVNKLVIVGAWTANSITCLNLDGTNLDSTGYSTYTSGGILTGQALSIKNITRANPARMTTLGLHNLDNGDWIQIVGVAGMSEINNRTVVVQNHTGDQCDLYDLDGFPLDTTGFTAYTVPTAGASNGRCRELFTKTMPYAGTDLDGIRYIQSADVMTLTHENYTPRTLTRQDHAVWALAEIDFAPTIGKPANIICTPSHVDTVQIDGITQTNPAVITLESSATDLWATGTAARITGVTGMLEFNNQVVVLGAQTATTPNKKFELQNTAGQGINATGYGAYTTGSTDILTGSTLYRYSVTALDKDGREGRATSAPVVLSRAMSAPYNTGTAPPKITLSWDAVDGASAYNVYRQREVVAGEPAQGSLYGFVGQSNNTQFVDQNVSPDFTRTPPKFNNPFKMPEVKATINNITNDTTIQVYTTAPHTFVIGDRIRLDNTGNMTQAEGLIGEVSNYSASSWFKLRLLDGGDYIDSTSWYDYTPPITGITQANPTVVTMAGGHNFQNGEEVILAGISGMTQLNSTAWLVDSRTATTIQLRSKTTGVLCNSTSYFAYTSGGIVRDNTTTATRITTQNNPICAAYYQQRRIFAGSEESPQTIWFSQSADYNNMDQSDPIRDSDSITFTLASLQVNKIKHLVPVANLLVLTSGGAFKVSGSNGSGVITPTSIQVVPQTYSGAGDLVPLVLNADVLYVKRLGTGVQGIAYNFYQDSYATQDLSIRAKHLLDGYTITEWAYAPEPHNLVYCIRSDGKVLILTYLKEVDVVAWSTMDSEGEFGVDAFESAAVITEGGESVTYFVVRRWICNANGCMFRQYVERMRTRNVIYNGKPDTMRGSFMDAGVYYDGVPINSVTTLAHLEGRTVQVMVDGNVLAPRKVVNGRVDLGLWGNVVMVGLGYSTEIETLPLDLGNGSVSGKRKRIAAVTVRVFDTRGIQVGHDRSSLVSYREIQQGLDDNTLIPLKTGDMRFNMFGNVDTDGSILVVQDQPLPLELLGVIPEVIIGDN